MQLSYIISGLSTMLAVTYAAPSSLVARTTAFIGSGQLIAEHDTDGTVKGCLTVDGLLTADTSLCGIFTGAYKPGSSSSILITTSAGNCGVWSNTAHQAVEFTCGANAPSGGSTFATITRTNQTNIFTGDLQFDYVPYEDVYPTESATTPIHLWGGSDSGDFVTLNWSAL